MKIGRRIVSCSYMARHKTPQQSGRHDQNTRKRSRRQGTGEKGGGRCLKNHVVLGMVSFVYLAVKKASNSRKSEQATTKASPAFHPATIEQGTPAYRATRHNVTTRGCRKESKQKRSDRPDSRAIARLPRKNTYRMYERRTPGPPKRDQDKTATSTLSSAVRYLLVGVEREVSAAPQTA